MTVLPWGIAPSKGGQKPFTAIVAPSGGDYTTLSAALAAVSAGATIWVMPGTYSEAGGTFAQANLTIMGAGDESVTMTLGANLTLSGNYIKLGGITIDGGTSFQFVLSGQRDELYGNHIKGSLTTYFASSSSYCGFSHNFFEATGGAARCLFTGTRQTIGGNHFVAPHTTNGGIYVNQNSTFTGNYIHEQQINGGGPALLNLQDFAVASGNSFFGGNGACATLTPNASFVGNMCYQMGGNIITAAECCTVTGNLIQINNGLSSDVGIFLNAAAGKGGTTITGNQIFSNNSGVGTGISVNAGVNNTIAGNGMAALGTGISISSGVLGTMLDDNAILSTTTQVSDSGTGTIRGSYAGFTQTQAVTVANTVTETTLFGTGVGSLTIPANTLVPGKTIRITITGVHSATANPNITINVKLGGTTIMTTGAVASSSSINAFFEVHAFITCYTTGTTGTIWSEGYYVETGGGAGRFSMGNSASSTVNTTIANAIDATVTWGTASASDTITASIAIVEFSN